MKGQYITSEVQVHHNQVTFFNKFLIIKHLSNIDIDIIYGYWKKLYAIVNSWVLMESNAEIKYLHT